MTWKHPDRFQKSSLRLISCLTAVLCFFTVGLQAQVKVTAIVEPNPMALGEGGQLQITIQGSQQAEPPQVEDNEYLQFAYRGPNTQIMTVNGVTTTSVTHVYQVKPLRTGKFRINPMTVFVDGKRYTTEEIILEVAEKTENSIDIKDIAFLEFDLPNRPVYVGETISSELRMVMMSQATFPNRGLPQVDGDAFSITPIDTQPSVTRAVKNGKYYDVYVWKIGITPVKAGPQTLQFQAQHVLRVPEGGNSSARRDPFGAFRDPFFDSMFGRYRDVEITSMSEPSVVTVASLPEQGKPASFNGAIGNFEIRATTDIPDLTEGDPITLKIEINGEGNFSQMSPPAFPANDSFKTYPPRVLNEELDITGYSGKKEFEYVVIPLSADIKEVPRIPFSYFNPRTGTYSETNTAAIPVSIKKAVQTTAIPQAGALAPQLNFRKQPENTQDLLLPIKVSLGAVVNPPSIGQMRNVMAVSVIAPIGILGLAFLIRRSRASSQKDMERNRLKALDQKMNHHRQEMQKARKDGDAASFYQAACRVLQVALARQLGCKPEAITGKDISSLWVPSLGNEETKTSIQNFFEKVDALRYSGNVSQSGALEKEELELESILGQLGKK
ncbi:MAG: BatD family protein [Verrucomicrobiae bacterium]|nr:BatD family protein [Verrucomicrobiae bacterium]